MSAKTEVADSANKWCMKIESLSLQPVMLRDSDDFDKEKLVRLPEGQVVLSAPLNGRQYNGTDYWASIIQAKVYTAQALDSILLEGKCPCWALDWNLKEDIDLDRLVSNIKEYTGRTPSSSNSVGVNGLLTGVEYPLEVDSRILRIYVGKGGYSGALATIGLRYEGSGEEGFYQVHKSISPDIILSFLLGEIALPSFRSAINEGMKPL